MQRTKSKLLSILLSLVMLLSLLPTTALAAGNPDPTAVSVNGGISFSSSNLYYTNGASACSNNSTGWNAAYDPTTGTLTLDGYSGGSIRTGGTDADITVVLKGTNTINDGSLMNDMGGDITITSDCGGTLSITNTLSNSNPAIGIEAGLSGSYQTGNVTITGDAKVTINMTNNGTSTWEKAYGIYAKENITISGDASVDITCKTPYNTARFGDYCNGLYAKNNVTIDTSGTIKIDVKNAGDDDAYSFGIYPMSGATLTKVGNMEVQWKKGVSSGGAVYKGVSFDTSTYAVYVDETTCTATYTPKGTAITGDLPVAITKPVKGETPQSAIAAATQYTGTIAWEGNPTTFAANTAYTAKVELTANTGYQFASDVNPTVTDATISEKSVSADGKTLTFKAAFAKTGSATLNGIDIITNPALTVAVPTAAPNATATNERSLAVTGVYDDGTGGPVAVNWKITTDPIPTGVSLDGSTLKVTNEAEAGQVRIEASSTEGGYTDAEFVTITKDTPVESAIVLTPPSSTTVAVPKSDTPNEIDLPTATVYDQYGKHMTGTFSITYEIVDTAPTGVTLNTAGGKMKVKRFAQAGVVEIVGKLTTTAGTVTSDPVTYTITRETSKVTDVLVSKLYHNMPVPKVTEPGGTSSEDQQFTAEVLDQYLQEMTGQTVTWRVTDTAGNPVHGVSIDNTGKLTVTNEAPGIKVYAIATCQGVDSNNLDMTLHRDTAKDTFVKICNQVGDAPETSLLIPAGSIPRSEDYTAKVYDQYGEETSGMVFWKLDKTYTGVELDTTSIPGSATLKVDNTAAPGTIKLIANCSTVGSTASKTLDITLVDKTPASVTAVPAAQTGLFYNGTDQALVTAGTASGGTMQYSLDGTTWSTAVPTGKNVGAYTVQYKVVGDATHTDTAPEKCQLVTISPKFLTMDNLTPTGSTSKVYDGTTDSSITVGVKAGVLFGSDTLTITGTAVYNSANVNEANTITFTPDAITGNYELVPGVLTIPGASITPRDLTVTPNAGQSKKFGAEDPTLHSTNSGRVPGQIPDFSGALSRAEGEDAGLYDITLGTLALIDHFSSGFKASNYTLKMVSPAVKFEIKKADAPAAPTGLKGYKDSALSTVTLPTGWSWVDGTLKMNTIGDQTFKANYAGDTNHQAGTNVDVTVKVVRRSSSGGGGSYYAPVAPDMPMVYWGCTGDAVKTLQEKLNAKGFHSGNVDGIFGAKTYAAVTAFQKANSLGVDGIVGKLTWAKLYDATPVNVTPVTTQPMLRTSSRGDAVRKLQELLNAKGYTCGSVDGIFGSKTYAAVLAFQKANGLGADGIVGPLTWAKLG